MAIWPFKRKRSQTPTNTSIPPEVQDYYNAQNRERVGVAWLIAIVSLLVSIAVVLGLFFGGRWVYRALFNNDSPSTADSTQQDQNNDQSSQSESNDQEDSQPSDSPNQPQSLPGDGSDQPSDAPAAQPQTSSSSTEDPGKIADAGPGDTLAIFLASSIAGTLAYQIVTRRRQNS